MTSWEFMKPSKSIAIAWSRTRGSSNNHLPCISHIDSHYHHCEWKKWSYFVYHKHPAKNSQHYMSLAYGNIWCIKQFYKKLVIFVLICSPRWDFILPCNHYFDLESYFSFSKDDNIQVFLSPFLFTRTGKERE